MKKEKILKIIITLLIVIILLGVLFYVLDHKRMAENKPVIFSTWGKSYAPPAMVIEDKKYNETEDINIVLTMDEEISANSAWCGTFQLIWNDLKNDLAKQDIVFTPQLKVVENLNMEKFNTKMLSEDSYYKVYGHPIKSLKEQIEKDIKKKFNEKSDILDSFEWYDENYSDYFLYCMLKKEFNFKTAFEDLQTGTFADKYKDVSYFGFRKNADSKITDQVTVLYYNSDDDFAIKLSTKENEEVILCKSEKRNTFNDIYNNIQEQVQIYQGNTSINDADELKIPNIKMKEKKEFKELENKPFLFSNGDEYIINTAVQTIEFELDKTGGKIKSEAGMTMEATAIAITEKERKFYLDDTFTIFLKEADKELPYFAAIISDITKFQ